MIDSDDDASLSSAIIEDQRDDVYFDEPTRDIVEDLTEDNNLLSDASTLASLNQGDGTPNIKPRAYQTEMLEESLKRNIIVAADTGSGKTHIAVLRIIQELERMRPGQLIWFLAPTVSLVSQQFDYIESQISAVQAKCLRGEDGVDRWTNQHHWDAVLKNVCIVVSTFQVLLDALSHGFIRMESLALIVFDEAHNCVAKHPGARIMQNFYHPRKLQGLQVPHVLGLTASPVMRSNPVSLKLIEETLDAICRTPTKHRAELRLQVNLPVLSQISYQSLPPEDSLTSYTKTIQSLGLVYGKLDIAEDPCVIDLLQENSEKSMMELQKIRLSHKSWSHKQMKSLHATSLRICREMGAYAADWYISQVIVRFTTMADENDNYLGLWDVSSAEKRYLAKALKQVHITGTAHNTPNEVIVSDKVTKLIDFIVEETSNFQGIIFVQTRAEVAVLSHLLSIHPRSRGNFRIGTLVGTGRQRAQNVGELIDDDTYQQVLALFKTRITNLVIATSVLEEGIDVPACNVVVCFQKPANLKSFVQRRGRARHRESKLILLLDPEVDKLSDWQQLELNMRRLYEDDMRKLGEVLVAEDTEEHDSRTFRVETTGAFLDLDNAMAHLYHFCATLPAKDFVDLRPDFICSDAGPALVRCQVTLPLSVNESVRKHESRNSWMSEKNAIKDAAFEAYLALYRAGLVNDNLLPLLKHDTIIDELTSSAGEKQAAIINVNEQINPWIDVAKTWKTSKGIQRYVLTLGELKLGVYLPEDLPPVAPFRLYWDARTEILVSVSSISLPTTGELLPRISEDTWSMLDASFGNRFRIERRQLVMGFSSDDQYPLIRQMGRQPVSERLQTAKSLHSLGLIRDKTDNNLPYQFRELLGGKPPMEMVQNPYENYREAPDVPHLSLILIPRRPDFLHKIDLKGMPISDKKYSVVLPVSSCTMDDLPFQYFQFGRSIPSIMRQFEITLLADRLSHTILKVVGITDLNLIVTAITASSANENENYQRLEFLGDSILKTCTSVQVVAEYPMWHEGYLTAKKDQLVSNSRLSKAALEIGLDKFIITRAFPGHKWRPIYVDDLLEAPTDARRNLSSKVLADVVEALCGAAMVDGGISKALTLLQLFLPELNWQALEHRRDFLFQRAPDVELPPTLQLLESLIGYTFKKKALLIESMTHASSTAGSESLERFEFLGDSILDNIIVTAMWGHEVELSHFQMHLLRTAMVNADLLAFMCMEWSIQQEKTDLVETKSPGGKVELKELSTTIDLPLWRFMKHMSPKLGAVQVATAKRHAEVRDGINAAIRRGSRYPWALLARLQAQKFYSDIVESLLGAVWIDSGSFKTCQAIVERMGILAYMRRILKDGAEVWHPKEKIGVLAGAETVTYRLGLRKKSGSEQGGLKEYWCKVFVGEREVVEVGDGVGKEEVKVKTAERAVEILEGRKVEDAGYKEATTTVDLMEDARVNGGESMDIGVDAVMMDM